MPTQEELSTLVAKPKWISEKLTQAHDGRVNLEPGVRELLPTTFMIVEDHVDFAKGALQPKVTDIVVGSVDKERMTKCAVIPGNIYAKFAIDGIDCTSRNAVKEILRVIIIIVQISAPGLMFWNIFSLGKWRSSSLDLTSPCHVLSVCMLFALGAYSIQVIESELSSAKKLKELLPKICANKGMLTTNPWDLFPGKRSWGDASCGVATSVIMPLKFHWSSVSVRCPMLFIVGAVVNASMLCLGLIATLFIYLSADGAGKIVMSVLSFSFLYKLDDASGAFGPLILTSNDWPENAMGDLWVKNCDSASEIASFIIASKPNTDHFDANVMALSLATYRLDSGDKDWDTSCLGCTCSLLFVATYLVKGLAILTPIAYIFGVWWQHAAQVTT